MNEQTIAGYLTGLVCFAVTAGIFYGIMWFMKDDFDDNERMTAGTAILALTMVMSLILYALMYFYVKKRVDITFTGLLSYLSGDYPSFMVLSVFGLCGMIAMIILILLGCTIYDAFTDADADKSAMFWALSIGAVVAVMLFML